MSTSHKCKELQICQFFDKNYHSPYTILPQHSHSFYLPAHAQSQKFPNFCTSKPKNPNSISLKLDPFFIGALASADLKPISFAKPKEKVILRRGEELKEMENTNIMLIILEDSPYIEV